MLNTFRFRQLNQVLLGSLMMPLLTVILSGCAPSAAQRKETAALKLIAVSDIFSKTPPGAYVRENYYAGTTQDFPNEGTLGGYVQKAYLTSLDYEATYAQKLGIINSLGGQYYDLSCSSLLDPPFNPYRDFGFYLKVDGHYRRVNGNVGPVDDVRIKQLSIAQPQLSPETLASMKSEVFMAASLDPNDDRDAAKAKFTVTCTPEELSDEWVRKATGYTGEIIRIIPPATDSQTPTATTPPLP